MANQYELDKAYMTVAEAHASLSKGERARVGACIVTPLGVILGGCNGLSSGGSNTLEYKEYMDSVECPVFEHYPRMDSRGFYRLVTKPEVIHAELNCTLKAAEQGVSVKDSTLYVTLSPCSVCSEMLLQIKIKRVVYRDTYRCTKGIDKLRKAGVECIQLNEKGVIQ